VSQEHTTAAPVCYRHPDRHTLLRCSRCERPICGACSIEASVGQRCPECVRQEGTQKVIPRQQIMSRAGGAPATRAFIGVAVVFFVLTGFGRSLNGPIGELFAQINVLVAEGEWWRLFSPVLLHASITHILFNMWALWVLGPQIERGVGTWPFVGAYLASAAAGGAFMYVMGGLAAPAAVGASGAIFGLFGIWANWAVRRRDTMHGRALLRQIGFLLLLNAALPFIIRGIAWEAHLGGLIAGFIIGELWSRARNETARIAITAAIAGLAVATVLIL
jgi:membrane associated rhomboid family serine protease